MSEALTTAPKPQGEWKYISAQAHLKGLRRDPKYYPAIGEVCQMSGPNCDDDTGYTWLTVEVLWRDDLFIVTRVKDCWPRVYKLDLVLFEPTPDPIKECLTETYGAAAPEFVAAFHAALEKRGLSIVANTQPSSEGSEA